MIESFVPGRVRLRSSLLNKPGIAELLKHSLLQIRGVRSVTVNERTGGLLLEYDTERLPLSLLSGALPLFGRLKSLESIEAVAMLPAIETILKELKLWLEKN